MAFARTRMSWPPGDCTDCIRCWPALDPAPVDDEEAGDRWAEHLGWNPTDQTFPWRGMKADDIWFGLSNERVREIASMVAVTDTEPLAEGGFIAAMFEWLLGLPEHQESCRRWIDRYRRNDRRASGLSEMHAEFLAAVKPTGCGHHRLDTVSVRAARRDPCVSSPSPASASCPPWPYSRPAVSPRCWSSVVF